MLSLTPFYLLAVIFSAAWTLALPLYPNSNLEPQADFIGLMLEVEDGVNAPEGEHREADHLYSLLTKHDGVGDQLIKAKDSVQQDNYSNLVEDLRETVLKLAAVDRLRSQAFLRSEHSLPKSNKRACFWKYCVTN